ncbi:MAPEG family protein [Sphingomonas sp. TREG-RG-20F-R18-01]|uniref:MAPEG family protein n=1 Tax=Sphingomonas sp. TREG-RG-20F-R18-01 TaxID=2914982 RepID=UPI003222208D
MMSGSDMTITLVTAGAAAIINLWLAIRVGSVRTKAKILLGDGGNEVLIRRMRAHANFVEYAPFIVILIGLIELTSGSSWWLWGASAAFLVARVAHALGMDGLPVGRMVGTILTFLLLLGLGGYAIAVPLLGHHARTTLAPSAVPAG